MNDGLKNLKEIVSRQNNGNGDLYLEATIIKPIEKDLEILEIIKEKAKSNRFYKGCLLRMFKENGEKKSFLDNPPKKIDKNYYKVKEWIENAEED